MTPMKWFYSFIKPYRPRIFLGLVLVTFLAALAIMAAGAYLAADGAGTS